MELETRRNSAQTCGEEQRLIEGGRGDDPVDHARLHASGGTPGSPGGNCRSLGGKPNKWKHNRPWKTFTEFWENISQLLDDKPYEIRESWGNTSWYLAKRLITASILTGAIVLGAIGQSFSIQDHVLWQKFKVNQDAQLAAFGLLNTILAILVRDSLGHISGVLITLWMVKKDETGASALDFEMSEELNKPWVAIGNFHARRKYNGWKLRDIIRFALGLTTGICLLLQGASINTVGMPKERWWPDTRLVNPDPTDDRFFFTNRTFKVAQVSRMSVWQRSWDMIREGGDISWKVVSATPSATPSPERMQVEQALKHQAHSIAAMSTLGALENIYRTIDQSPGWQHVGDQDAAAFSALNVTNHSTPSFQAVSVYGRSTIDMWNDQKTNGNNMWARRSIGWFATLKVTGILLDAACSEESGSAVGSWQASSDDDGKISLKVGPYMNTGSKFDGAICTISIRQILIALRQWIVSNSGSVERLGNNINNWGSTPYPEVDYLPLSAADVGIAHEMADWFNAVVPQLQSLLSDSESVNLTSTAMQIAEAVVDMNKGHTSMDGLAMVVAAIFSSFPTTFSWDYEEVEGMMTRQGPIRWQIYGSGPRLKWQWAIAVVIGVNIVVQLADIFLIVVLRRAKGQWLSLGGMMVAANVAERMAPIRGDQGAGFVTEKGKFVKFFVRESTDKGQVGIATLVSEEEVTKPEYSELKERRVYGKQE